MKKWLKENDIKEYVENRGFQLISIERKTHTRVNIKCENGHLSNVQFSSFKSRKSGCLSCRVNNKKTYKEVKTYIENKGFHLISSVYINSSEKLLLKCKNGHTINISYNSVQSGTKCSKCYGNFKKNIGLIEKSIKKEGYTLIDFQYKNSFTKFRVKCNKEHVYVTSWNNFQSGRRCPTCNHPKIRENKCRSILENIFNKKFPTKRPKWLKDDCDRNPLELDGYCKELKMAFEYDGEMHYKPIYGKKQLLKQKERDLKKDRICKKHDIILVRIPYWIKDLKEYIIGELNEYSKKN